MDEPILAWYFTGPDRRTLHGGGVLRTGGVEEFVGELELGHRGLHASVDPIDALIHGHGPIACRVQLSGKHIEGATQSCASQRSVLWLADASSLLVERARKALAVDADVENEAELRQALASAREDVEDAFDALRDGEWSKHERGQDVDLDALRAEVERARLRARQLDVAARLCTGRFDAIRSVYEDLRELGLEVELERELERLPKLGEVSEEPSHPMDPMEISRGPLFEARDALGRELGKLLWVTRVGFGLRHPVGAHVLFIETKGTKRLDPRRESRLVVEHIRGCLALNAIEVVLDRAHAFRFDLRASALFTDGAERTRCETKLLEQLGEIALIRETASVDQRAGPLTWRAHLKRGPAITVSPLDKMHMDNMAAFAPRPETDALRSLIPHQQIGSTLYYPNTSNGLKAWEYMTYIEACLSVRKTWKLNARPAVVIEDGEVRQALRVRRIPKNPPAGLRLIAGTSYVGPTSNGVRQGVRLLGRCATFQTFAVPQDLLLEDVEVSERLQTLPWVLAAWFLALPAEDCLAIEIWRSHPHHDVVANAMSVAGMWRDLVGPTRLLVAFCEAAERWVFVDDQGVAVEIYPLNDRS